MDERQQRVYEFGPFQLDARRRLLLRQDRSIPLTPKALELLLVLIEHSGRVVEKDELMRRLWPDSFVEEGNLAFNVSNLRKALGESPGRRDYIVTIPGRGYQFVAPVKPLPDAGLPTKEVPVRPVAKAVRFRGLSAGIAVILVVAAAAGLWMRRGRTSGQPAVAAPPPFSSVGLARLTNTGEAGLAAISPDGKYVVHVAVEGGRQGLQVRQVRAPSSVQVVPPAEVSYDGLIFSPDGQSIFYSRVEGEARSAALFRVPMLGGAPAQQVSDDVDTSISFSPDAGRFVFVRGYPRERESCLIVASADGSRERKLACRAHPDLFGLTGVAWSPDGQTIAVPMVALAAPAQDRVVLVDASSGAERPFRSPNFQRIGFLGWLPDQSGMVVDAAPTGQGHGRYAGGQLWLLPYPAGSARRLTNDLSDYYGVSVARAADSLVSIQRDPRSTLWVADGGDSLTARTITSAVTARDGESGIGWTPDGTLVFASLAGGSWDIWTSNADGTQRRQLTSDPAAETFPTVAPDGRTILFLSDRAGSSDLWRMDADGANLRQLTQGAAVVRAAFLPGGGEIVYSGGAPPGRGRSRPRAGRRSRTCATASCLSRSSSTPCRPTAAGCSGLSSTCRRAGGAWPPCPSTAGAGGGRWAPFRTPRRGRPTRPASTTR